MLVVLPHENDFDNGLDDTDGAKVKARDQAIADVVNGQLANDNISPAAAIAGTKISTTTPIPTDRIQDDAITDAKLRDDASTDGNRAVTTNHIRDAAVTAAKIGALAVVKAKVKVSEFDWVPAGTFPADGVGTITTGITAATGIPLLAAVIIAGAPTPESAHLGASIHINAAASNTYYLVLHNGNSAGYPMGGVTVRFFYIPVS